MLVLDQENLASELANVSTAAQIVSLLIDSEHNFGISDEYMIAIRAIFARGIELSRTFEDVLSLSERAGNFNIVFGDETDSKIFFALVSLATSESQVNYIYFVYRDIFGHREIEHRNMIRTIFDKADALGLKANASICN